MLATQSGALVEGKLTGVTRHDNVEWDAGLRFVERDGQRILQQRFNCYETDHDNESSRQWKEWRDVPLVVESSDEPDSNDVDDAQGELPIG